MPFRFAADQGPWVSFSSRKPGALGLQLSPGLHVSSSSIHRCGTRTIGEEAARRENGGAKQSPSLGSQPQTCRWCCSVQPLPLRSNCMFYALACWLVLISGCWECARSHCCSHRLARTRPGHHRSSKTSGFQFQTSRVRVGYGTPNRPCRSGGPHSVHLSSDWSITGTRLSHSPAPARDCVLEGYCGRVCRRRRDRRVSMMSEESGICRIQL